MESLYLLIPLSLLLVLGIGGLLVWSVLGGQFDNLDVEGSRILAEDCSAPATDADATSDPVVPRRSDAG